MSKRIIHSFMIPVVFESAIEDKTYIIADGKWTEVEKGFNWSDIFWFKKPFKGGKNEAFKIDLEFDVQGSKGKIYKVKYYNKQWSCSCPSFGWGGRARTCKHIELKKKEIEEGKYSI